MARVFAVIRSRGPAWDETRSMEQQTDWAGHATFMDALYAEEVRRTNRMGIGRADDANQIEARLSADPWTGSQHLSTTSIAPWTLRLGSIGQGN